MIPSQKIIFKISMNNVIYTHTLMTNNYKVTKWLIPIYFYLIIMKEFKLNNLYYISMMGVNI